MQLEEMRAELRQMGLLGEKATNASIETLLVHLLRTITMESRLRYQREQEIIDLLIGKDLSELSAAWDVGVAVERMTGEDTMAPAATRILGEGAWSGTE